MKLLHTSDWHLGRSLHGIGLTDAQDEFLAALVRVVVDRAVDCVVVSGDVFDRAIPPIEALRSYERALGELAQHATVVVVAGNHDSATRLGFAGSLLRPGIHVRTDPVTVGEPVVLADEHGDVLIYPVPYLDPDHCRHFLADGDDPLPRSHQEVMAAAMRRIAADLSRRRTENADPVRSVVVAHAFVAGGAPSESERDIQVGGVACVDPSLFADHDYVALGHLHRQQFVSGSGRGVLAYAGSPLRYSFDEAGDHKSVTIAVLSAAGVDSVSQVEVPQPRAMTTLTDCFDALLQPEVIKLHRDSWLRIQVTDPARPERLFERIRERYPHALSIRHQPGTRAAPMGPVAAVAGASPIQVASQFVADVTNSAPDAAEALVLTDAFTAVSNPAGG